MPPISIHKKELKLWVNTNPTILQGLAQEEDYSIGTRNTYKAKKRPDEFIRSVKQYYFLFFKNYRSLFQ
ncbi:hypothetical protein CJ263_08980 [Maribacter cobaltidurans]|uniref:Uncharacterized protein n=1 Tax=Maribacter cobaltidurans TaxID=1178778 RepID=A0A223V555_9FLAO|nr:hypothetical protein CJ263_08980 [Maribacter cobaltidurans]